VNDLDLSVVDVASSRVHIGNEKEGQDRRWDDVNNVESVSAPLRAGKSTLAVRVGGARVPQGPQSYSVVFGLHAVGGDDPSSALTLRALPVEDCHDAPQLCPKG
jgi:hypothetical protein